MAPQWLIPVIHPVGPGLALLHRVRLDAAFPVARHGLRHLAVRALHPPCRNPVPAAGLRCRWFRAFINPANRRGNDPSDHFLFLLAPGRSSGRWQPFGNPSVSSVEIAIAPAPLWTHRPDHRDTEARTFPAAHGLFGLARAKWGDGTPADSRPCATGRLDQWCDPALPVRTGARPARAMDRDPSLGRTVIRARRITADKTRIHGRTQPDACDHRPLVTRGPSMHGPVEQGEAWTQARSGQFPAQHCRSRAGADHGDRCVRHPRRRPS